jgi:signal peptidase I
MIGDNWYNSLDSRFWGFVPEDDIISKITMIFFSLDETTPKSDNVNIKNSIRWNRIGQIVK